MKQIDDIFPAYINGGIGPCSTLRRFVRDADYLKSRGYIFNLYSRDFLFGQSFERPVDFSKGLKFRSFLKKVFKTSRVMTVAFQIRERREVKKLVLKYIGLGRTPDVMVFHEMTGAYLYMKYRKEKSAKILLFHHSDGLKSKMLLDSYPKLKNTWWLKKILKEYDWVNENVDRNIFIANIGKYNFIKENPRIAENTLVAFHNGIDDLPIVPKSQPTDYKYNLCTTGSVCRRKGQYIIVEALNKVSEEAKKMIHVSVIGEGNDLEELRLKTKMYGLENNITFLGYMLNKDVHEYLCGCDAYILMSSSEGLPISIIEAMRAGLGIISTPVAGIPEQVSDDNGILVNPNPKELAHVFENFDKYNWKKYGDNSRLKFEQEYTFPKMLSSFCDVVDGLF